LSVSDEDVRFKWIALGLSLLYIIISSIIWTKSVSDIEKDISLFKDKRAKNNEL
jgi:hypothetical protein